MQQNVTESYTQGVHAEKLIIHFQYLAEHLSHHICQEQQILRRPIYNEAQSVLWWQRRHNLELSFRQWNHARQQVFIYQERAKYHYERYINLERQKLAANNLIPPNLHASSSSDTNNTPPHTSDQSQTQYMTFNQGSNVVPPVPVLLAQPGRLPINLSQGAIQTESRGVFVGNIAYNADVRQLKAFFEGAGVVVRCHVPISTQKKNKGFAVITYRTGQEASTACQMFDGRLFDGRALRVRLDRHEFIKR